ncbi:MAG: excinuclease ABC subunit UvrA [Rikenellaceae bacterium]
MAKKREKKQKDYIKIRGARVHNLKNIDLDIAHGELVVVTGLSGSGKSTLAFDTIFAEGQRRYVESLSAYARQFLGKTPKPDVDSIEGIAPAVAIEQRVSVRNIRSTVGTTTEIYDYLRLLFARIGKTYSPVSGVEVRAKGTVDVLKKIEDIQQGARIILAVELSLAGYSGVVEALLQAQSDGFSRFFTLESGMTPLEDILQNQEKYSNSAIYIIIDRFSGGGSDSARVLDSAGRAYEIGRGGCVVIWQEGQEGQEGQEWTQEKFSNRFEADGITFETPTEHLFSFNNPLGACPVCQGYGKVTGIDEELVVPDKSKSIYDDAVVCWRGETMSWWKRQLISAASESGIPIHKPFYELSLDQKKLIWTGGEGFKGLNDFFKFLEAERYKIQYRVMLSRYTGKSICQECGGGRLRKEALYVRVGGRTIVELVTMPVGELRDFISAIELDKYDMTIGGRVLEEVVQRLNYLCDVGLDYLSLDRASNTLSGGESQRISLSTSLGSTLVGSLYILDEPSIGLHPRDNRRLIKVLKQLRDLGNSVIVVEHEREVIDAADTLIDIGPFAGEFGGEVVWQGRAEDMKPKDAKRSLTCSYLLGLNKIEEPASTRKWRNFIEVKGARQNNLKNIDVKIPLGVMTCVTGVSGSGKSSLVGGIVYPAMRREVLEMGSRPGDFDGLEGDVKLIKNVEYVDQNPIGKSSRSNPVTYIKAYDDIRKLFASQPRAEAQRLEASSFSFNIAGGRCDECKGEGEVKISMQFMADVILPCEECGGKRFKDKILSVKYRGKSIYDVLEMSVTAALKFFEEDASNELLCQKIVQRLRVLDDVGLGYVKLGQSSATLSGGETQRVKLAAFLLKERGDGHTLFIFDEPTTGLHFEDVKKLLRALNALVDADNTVLIVEHNMDVIKSADWVIDIGVEAGVGGGNVVFEGTPKALAESNKGYTAKFLKEVLI